MTWFRYFLTLLAFVSKNSSGGKDSAVSVTDWVFKGRLEGRNKYQCHDFCQVKCSRKNKKSSCEGKECVSHPAAFLEQRYMAKREGLKHGFIPFYCSKKTIWTDSSNFPSCYFLPPPSFSENLIICTHIDLVSYWWWHTDNCIFLSDEWPNH